MEGSEPLLLKQSLFSREWMEPELRIMLSLPPEDLGLLLANLTSMREMAEDKLEDLELVELARRELRLVRRVRGQIEEAVGAGHAAELEEGVQGLYGEALEAMGFFLDDDDPNMRP